MAQQREQTCPERGLPYYIILQRCYNADPVCTHVMCVLLTPEGSHTCLFRFLYTTSKQGISICQMTCYRQRFHHLNTKAWHLGNSREFGGEMMNYCCQELHHLATKNDDILGCLRSHIIHRSQVGVIRCKVTSSFRGSFGSQKKKPTGIRALVTGIQLLIRTICCKASSTAVKNPSGQFKFHTKDSHDDKFNPIFYTLGKMVVTPQNEIPFWRIFIFYLLVRSKGRLVGRIYFFLCILWAIMFNVYFGKFVITFIDTREIGCMSIPKYHWMVIVVNLTNLIFCMMLPFGLVLCILSQYRLFPPLAARRCRGSTGISAHLTSMAWWRSQRFRGGLSILVIAQPNSSQICSMRLQYGDLAGCSIDDIALLKEIKDYPIMVRCGILILEVVVILEMLAGKWHWGVSQNAPIELPGEVSVRQHKRRFGTTVRSSPDVNGTTTSLDPKSLAPLLEVLTR